MVVLKSLHVHKKETQNATFFQSSITRPWKRKGNDAKIIGILYFQVLIKKTLIFFSLMPFLPLISRIHSPSFFILLILLTKLELLLHSVYTCPLESWNFLDRGDLGFALIYLCTNCISIIYIDMQLLKCLVVFVVF